MSLADHDLERISGILAEDAIHGIRQAAARSGVTERTIRRYRKKAEEDEVLSARVREKKVALLKGWQDEAIRFMHKCLAKMAELVEDATAEQLRDVNGSAKIVGELLVANGVLGGGQSEPDSQSAAHAAPPSGIRGTSVH